MSGRSSNAESELVTRAVAFLPGSVEEGQSLEHAPPYVSVTPWIPVKAETLVESIERGGHRFRNWGHIGETALIGDILTDDVQQVFVITPGHHLRAVHDEIMNDALPRTDFPRGAAGFDFKPYVEEPSGQTGLKIGDYFPIHDLAVLERQSAFKVVVHSLVTLDTGQGFFEDDENTPRPAPFEQ